MWKLWSDQVSFLEGDGLQAELCVIDLFSNEMQTQTETYAHLHTAYSLALHENTSLQQEPATINISLCQPDVIHFFVRKWLRPK